jgi:hypothetical protein
MLINYSRIVSRLVKSIFSQSNAYSAAVVIVSSNPAASALSTRDFINCPAKSSSSSFSVALLNTSAIYSSVFVDQFSLTLPRISFTSPCKSINYLEYSPVI